jgi:hypothetical protein
VTIQDLDEEEIQLTLQSAIKLGRMNSTSVSQTNSESILRGLGLFDDGRLVNAAIVLYGKSERLFQSYPQLSIRLARFRGADRLTGFMDNREYWGHAFALLKRVKRFFPLTTRSLDALSLEKWFEKTTRSILPLSSERLSPTLFVIETTLLQGAP